jgi:hypothetical protein
MRPDRILFLLGILFAPQPVAAREPARFLLRGQAAATRPSGTPTFVEFRTARGSRYTRSGWGTARFKAATRESFAPSDLTVYIDGKTHIRLLDELRLYNVGTKARVRMLDTGDLVIAVKDRDTGFLLELRGPIPYSHSVGIGKHPIELTHKDPRTGETIVHIGHQVTEIVPGPRGGSEARARERR